LPEPVVPFLVDFPRVLRSPFHLREASAAFVGAIGRALSRASKSCTPPTTLRRSSTAANDFRERRLKIRQTSDSGSEMW
jgi:hypothetical protein